MTPSERDELCERDPIERMKRLERAVHEIGVKLYGEDHHLFHIPDPAEFEVERAEHERRRESAAAQGLLGIMG